MAREKNLNDILPLKANLFGIYPLMIAYINKFKGNKPGFHGNGKKTLFKINHVQKNRSDLK